jgi:hypothetical protein
VLAALQQMGIGNNNNTEDYNDTSTTSMESMIMILQQLPVLTNDVTSRMDHYTTITTELQQLYDTIHQQTSLIYHTDMK